MNKGIGLVFLGFLCLLSIPLASQDRVSLATGEASVAQEDIVLLTAAGGVPIARNYLPSHPGGILGKGWELDILSRIEFIDENHFFIVKAHIPTLFTRTAEGVFRGLSGVEARRKDAQWVVDTPAHLVSLYDERGLEISRRDANGNTIQFSYDAGGRVTDIQGIEGHALAFRYGKGGFLTSIDGASGERCAYAYNSSGLLAEVIDADGWKTVYAYSKDGRLSEIAYPSGETVRLTYDPTGRVGERLSSSSLSYRYAYGEATRVTRQDGFWFEVVHNPKGQPIEFRDSLKRRETSTWDDKGRLAARQFLDGSAASYVYDDRDRLVKQTTSRGRTLEIAYDGMSERPSRIAADGAISRFAYDAKGNLISTMSPAGRRMTCSYDDAGRRISFTDGEGRATRFEYDQLGRLVKQNNPDNSFISWDYDSHGRLLSQRDPSGRVSRYEYGGRGLLAALTESGGERIYYEYDPDGRLISETRGAQAIRYAYDKMGLLVRVEYPDKTAIAVDHDPLGRPIKFTDPLGMVTRKEYDALGRLVKTVFPTGLTAASLYDAAGNLESFSLGKSVVGIALTEGGRTLALKDPVGAETRIVRNGLGQIIQRTLPSGGIERLTYDPDGLPVSVALPTGDLWRFVFDQAGQLNQVIFPGGEVQKRAYDIAGRLASVVSPWGGKTTSKYDFEGQRVEAVNARGETVRFKYDESGQLVSKESPGEKWSFQYDSRGNMIQAGDGEYTVRNSYDGLDRLVRTEFVEWGKSLNYEYDKFGRLAVRSGPDGNRTSYSYDALGRIAAITDGKGRSFKFSYDDHNRLISRTAPNRTATHFKYDIAGRMHAINHQDVSGRVLASRTYAYDPSGNPAEILDENGRKCFLNYDVEGKLISEKGQGFGRAYVYGRAGNRTSAAGPSGTEPYVYDQGGRLVQAGKANLSYDADGNLISWRDERGEIRYAYDAEGNLTRVDLPGGKTISHGYGPFGERIWREEGGKRTWFLYDGDDLLEELGADFKPAVSYLHAGLDQPLLAEFPDGKTAVFHQDSLGSILAVSNGKGEVIGRYSYDAFGNILYEEEKEFTQPLRFTGRPFDKTTGLYDLRARFYDPGTGRFVSPDPILGYVEDPVMFNPYLYAHGNPLSYSDPLGMADDLFSNFMRRLEPWSIMVDPRGRGDILSEIPNDMLNHPAVAEYIRQGGNKMEELYGPKAAQVWRDRASRIIRDRIQAVEGTKNPTRNVKPVQAPAHDPGATMLAGQAQRPANASPEGVQGGGRLQQVRSWLQGAAQAGVSRLQAIRRWLNGLGLGRVVNWGNTAQAVGGTIGEAYDIGTGEWQENAAENISTTATTLIAANAGAAVVGTAAPYVGGAFLSEASVATLAAGATGLGVGTIVAATGYQTYQLYQEGMGYWNARGEENANAARETAAIRGIENSYASIIQSLKDKLQELERLLPVAQKLTQEIKDLELEMASKLNAMQVAMEKIDQALGRAREAASAARRAQNEAAQRAASPQQDASMAAQKALEDIENLRKEACDFADRARIVTQETDLEDLKRKAEDSANRAAEKAGEVARLAPGQAPSVTGAPVSSALSDAKAAVEEIEDLLSGMESDSRFIEEQSKIIGEHWKALDSAHRLRWEVQASVSHLRNFKDLMEELPDIRQRAEVSLPPKEEVEPVWRSAQETREKAVSLVERGRRAYDEGKSLLAGLQTVEDQGAVTPTQRLQEELAAEVEQANRLAAEARACAERARQVSIQRAAPDQGFRPSGSGTIKTTSGSGEINLLGQTTSGQPPAMTASKPPAQSPPPDGTFRAGGSGQQQTTGQPGQTQPRAGQTGSQPGQNPPLEFTLNVHPAPATGSTMIPCHIFSAGSRLGWATGLMRFASGPTVDRGIVQHLQVAGEHVMWANRLSQPPIMAWPNWASIRTQFQTWIGELTRGPQAEERQRLTHSIEDYNTGLSHGLAYGLVANEIRSLVNCDSKYVILGFDLAYGQVCLQIAQSALGRGEGELHERARAEGINSLRNAQYQISEYEKIVKASTRCADLRGVHRMINQLIGLNDINSEVQAANSTWDAARQTICSLSGQLPAQPAPPSEPETRPQEPIPPVQPDQQVKPRVDGMYRAWPSWIHTGVLYLRFFADGTVWMTWFRHRYYYVFTPDSVWTAAPISESDAIAIKIFQQPGPGFVADSGVLPNINRANRGGDAYVVDQYVLRENQLELPMNAAFNNRILRSTRIRYIQGTLENNAALFRAAAYDQSGQRLPSRSISETVVFEFIPVNW